MANGRTNQPEGNMSDKTYQMVRRRFLTGSRKGHMAFGRASPPFCTIPSCGRTEVALSWSSMTRPRRPQPERSHVKLVAGDPPMLRLEINLYSWERGDSEIEIVLPHGGELSDLLHW